MNGGLSHRVTQIKPSATMAVNAKATELRAAGHDIINLSVGEPDFETPDFIKAAAIEAINANFTKYTAADGIPELKEAIISKLANDNQLSYESNQIIVGNGVKQCLFNLTQALLSEGDEAIIPAPYWVSYPAMVELAGAKPVFVSAPMSQNFKITAEQLEAAITPKTRLLFLNSPSNPTGKAYTADELQALGEVLLRHPDVTITVDDIYEYILWGHAFASLLNVSPTLSDRVVVMNGVSKAHAMTGWRIGYAAGPIELINAMKKIQSQSTSNPCSISQKAAVAALRADRSFFTPMLAAYKERHDLVFSALDQMGLVSVLPSDGTFYSFPDVSDVIKKHELKDDVALCEFLLEKANVAVVPGTAFGAPGFLRISFATSNEILEKALERLAPLFN